MPGYKVHLVGGAVTFACLYALLSSHIPTTSLIIFQWLGASLLGALFPDVDIKSKGQGLFYKGMLLCLALLLCKKQGYLFVAMSFLALVPVLVRHRGIFHCVWFVIVVPFAVAFVAGNSFPAFSALFFYNACFFSAGALSHIMLDRLV